MKKAIIITAIIIAVLSISVVLALSIFHRANVSITISEPMGVGGGWTPTEDSITEDVFFIGNVGDSLEKNFTVHNSLDHSVNIELEWSDNNNTGIIYTTNMPYSRMAPPGDSIYEADWFITDGSPPGILNGTVSLTRL